MRARVTTTITFGVDNYAREYGIERSEVPADAQSHIEESAHAALQEQFTTRLGWGAVGKTEVTIHSKDSEVTAHEARHGLPTGFEHTHLADLIALHITLNKAPTLLVDGTHLRVRNELNRRPQADVTQAYAAYWDHSDSVGLPRPR